MTAPIPALPVFPYPLPLPQSFTIPLGERGFSSIHVEVTFRPLEMPAQRAHVDVVLRCIAAHPRRISSVMLSLMFPDNDVEDLHPTDDFGPETPMHVETTHNTEVGLNAGIAWQGMSAGGGWKRGVGEIESATRITRRTIKGLVKDANTALWSLEEDVAQRGGLPIQVLMRFTLGYKPDRGVFKCRVTSVKDGKEREKYGSQKYPGKRSLKDGLSSFVKF